MVPIVGIVVLRLLASCSTFEKSGQLDIHNFTQLELVQDSGLSGSIKTNHQDSHLFLSP